MNVTLFVMIIGMKGWESSCSSWSSVTGFASGSRNLGVDIWMELGIRVRIGAEPGRRTRRIWGCGGSTRSSRIGTPRTTGSGMAPGILIRGGAGPYWALASDTSPTRGISNNMFFMLVSSMASSCSNAFKVHWLTPLRIITLSLQSSLLALNKRTSSHTRRTRSSLPDGMYHTNSTGDSESGSLLHPR